MYQEEVKKPFLLLSSDLILSVLISFGAVIAFSYTLHVVDMRLQGKDVSLPFVEQFNLPPSTFLFTATIAQSSSKNHSATPYGIIG